mmetsp:Transcript_37848/g.46059  ORF Transcript_37848/g.46059 Transcript_37848/m.46059 type:complete len:277 (+) Transcript_37848:57-887(+)
MEGEFREEVVLLKKPLVSLLTPLHSGHCSSSVTGTLLLFFSLSLGVNLSDDGLDAGLADHLADVAGLDDAQLDILLRLDHLEESLDRQPHRCLLILPFSILALQELTKLLGLLTDGASFPLTDGTRGLSLEQLGLAISEAGKEGGNTKGASAATLRVLLLGLTTEASNVLHSGHILILESETLALEADLVDQDASIGLQASKCAHQVLIDTLDLADSAGVLQLGDGVFFHGENHAVVANDSDRGAAAIHSLKCVLHLEQLAIGGEDGVCFIVAWHF